VGGVYRPFSAADQSFDKRTACQWGKDPAQFVDDLLQETYLKLCADKCRLLLEFAEQHSDAAVLGYIKTIAINVAHDHFKSLHSQKRGAGETDQLLEDFDPAAQSSSYGGPVRPSTARSF
jgi:RNA polymerase sigma-70 factor (ECF subfamily)